jgi:hypothetical protein
MITFIIFMCKILHEYIDSEDCIMLAIKLIVNLTLWQRYEKNYQLFIKLYQQKNHKNEN